MDYSEYVATRRTALVRTVVLLGCPVRDAEDVVQTALLRCYRQWRKVQRAERPDAYVHTIVVNTWRDAVGRRWNGEVPTDVLPDTAQHADETTGIAVRRALARLDPPQREVLVLRYYAGMSEREIAAALGIAPGTVKSRAARGITGLAADLRSPDVF
ncbi:SigE family RNA polymerase sigma factor [Nocardioides sp.]|uniref:SigE family RNA polymerase sigma factor n=1 Tax=Nocardioides sp. TaxID=35761 RepID=UPI0026379238|nr:SigE family RNA polymerase sigma factor [Nocardioides sp.]